MFDAIVIDKGPDARSRAELRRVDAQALPEGDVTVQVDWSTLNYKDALAITGRAPIIRQFPMVPGIDLAGTVLTSSSPAFAEGDRVILNGWSVGEQHWGGLAQRAKLKSDWLIHTPKSFTQRQAMALGTAGYTAMLCVMALERAGVKPSNGPVLVSGASGGVGSVSVMLLTRLGYHVVAMTGRPAESSYLNRLGANEIIDRAGFEKLGRPLDKARWAGAIDVAGGQVLASICAATQPRGAVAACGLAASMELPVTVAPFILRGVSLLGIDSVYCPKEERVTAWGRLSELIEADRLEETVTEVSLATAIDAASDLLDGRSRGRLVVRTHSIPLDLTRHL